MKTITIKASPKDPAKTKVEEGKVYVRDANDDIPAYLRKGLLTEEEANRLQEVVELADLI